MDTIKKDTMKKNIMKEVEKEIEDDLKKKDNVEYLRQKIRKEKEGMRGIMKEQMENQKIKNEYLTKKKKIIQVILFLFVVIIIMSLVAFFRFEIGNSIYVFLTSSVLFYMLYLYHNRTSDNIYDGEKLIKDIRYEYRLY